MLPEDTVSIHCCWNDVCSVCQAEARQPGTRGKVLECMEKLNEDWQIYVMSSGNEKSECVTWSKGHEKMAAK